MTSQEAARTSGTARPFKAALTRLAQRREYGVGFLLAATLAVVSWKNLAFASAANLADLLVQCAPAVIVGPTGVLQAQNDVVFTACPKTGAPANGVACTAATTIISAQVNFKGTTTFVQAWSVNR